MVQKDFEAEDDYNKGFPLNKVFNVFSAGVVTSRDRLVVDSSKNNLSKRIEKFFNSEIDFIKTNMKVKENQSFKIDNVLKTCNYSEDHIKSFSYRPFDKRYVYYDKNFIERYRTDIMQHFLKGKNVGLTLCKQFKAGNTYQHIFITDKIIESSYVSNKTSEITSIFPLYLYPKNNEQQTIEETANRTPNLNQEIINEISKKLSLTFTNEKEVTTNTFAPIDVLDYIYAVLHSPTYRDKYKEFLKIDFPRVPYPNDKNRFWQLVKLGGEIRQIHLLESTKVEDYITSYPKGGDNIITTTIGKKDWELFDEDKKLGRIWINDEQYFDNIPLTAWEFYIGGYQPAQKWLKDRKERTLEFDDILHYQKIIVALSETDRLMKEIDKIEIE